MHAQRTCAVQGHIYCMHITAKLAHNKLKVSNLVSPLDSAHVQVVTFMHCHIHTAHIRKDTQSGTLPHWLA